eukprot:14065404-Heterocapsa_arctica.AAC.1
MDALLKIDFTAPPFGVTINPYPAAPATKAVDFKVDDATIADLQTGVKKPEPPPPRKRWGSEKSRDWNDVNEEEPEDVPGDSTDIYVESESVNYAR